MNNIKQIKEMSSEKQQEKYYVAQCYIRGDFDAWDKLCHEELRADELNGIIWQLRQILLRNKFFTIFSFLFYTKRYFLFYNIVIIILGNVANLIHGKKITYC